MQEAERVGARVAAVHKLRGYSQRELARRAHIFYSLLSKVESGHAPATPAFIGAAARALGVEVPRLTGQPYERPGRRASRLHATVEPLRRSLATFDLPSEQAAPQPIGELQASVLRASDLGRSGSHHQPARLSRPATAGR